MRAYVLGDREQPGAVPTADDIAAMVADRRGRRARRARSASRPAAPCSTSSIDGEVVPGTTATAEELIEIGRAMGRVGHGVFEMASDLKREWDEFGWMGALSRETGLPVTFAALQSIAKELPLDEQIEQMRAENDNGANIVAQIALRGNGIVMAWQGTVHPFRLKPGWAGDRGPAVGGAEGEAARPGVQGAAAGRGKRLHPGQPATSSSLIMVVCGGWTMQFEMDPDFDYEPQAEAEHPDPRRRGGRISAEEYAYDLLMRDEGKGFIYLPLLNYADGNLDFLEELQAADDTVNSLSDGGAHCGTICDAASPTFMLQHWVRDRKRGKDRPNGS